MKQFDGKNFVYLKHPQCSVTKNWRGDYCYSSDKWTPELTKALQTDTDVSNGFWMIESDFFKYFVYCTICKKSGMNVILL